jgi:hypothetical protein
VTVNLRLDSKVNRGGIQTLHAEMTQGLEAFLQRYSNTELQVLVKVLTDLMAVEKVGVRIAIPE